MKPSLTHAFIAATLMLVTNTCGAYAAPIPVAFAGQQIDSNLLLTRQEPTSLGLEGDEPATFVFASYQDAESKSLDVQTNATGEEFVTRGKDGSEEEGHAVDKIEGEVLQQRNSLQRRWVPGGSPRVLTTVDDAIQSSAVQQAAHLPQGSLLDGAASISQSSPHTEKMDPLSTSSYRLGKYGKSRIGINDGSRAIQKPLSTAAQSAAVQPTKRARGKPKGSKNHQRLDPPMMSPSDLELLTEWTGRALKSIPHAETSERVRLLRASRLKEKKTAYRRQQALKLSIAEKKAVGREKSLMRKLHRQGGYLEHAEAQEFKDIRQLLGRKGEISIESGALPKNRIPGQVTSGRVGAHPSDAKLPDTRVADATSSYGSLPSSPRHDAVLHSVENLGRLSESTAFSSPHPYSPNKSPSMAFMTAPHEPPASSSQTGAQNLGHQLESGQASVELDKDDYWNWLAAQDL